MKHSFSLVHSTLVLLIFIWVAVLQIEMKTSTSYCDMAIYSIICMLGERRRNSVIDSK